MMRQRYGDFHTSRTIGMIHACDSLESSHDVYSTTYKVCMQRKMSIGLWNYEEYRPVSGSDFVIFVRIFSQRYTKIK